MQHRYRIGQTVTYRVPQGILSSMATNVIEHVCEVVRLMPADEVGVPQYHLRGQGNGTLYFVSEAQIRPIPVAAGTQTERD